MAECHNLMHFGNVLFARRMQNEGVSIPGDFQIAIGLFLNLANLPKKGTNITPF
jgi:hypothetical protein